MEPIRVVVHGAAGRMGREVMAALCRDPELEPAGAVDKAAAEEYLSLPDGSGLVPFSTEVEAIVARVHPQVVVDFSVAEATLPMARAAARHGVNLVIGTTGLSQETLDEIASLCAQHQVGAVAAPNFSLGAVIMIHLARLAAPFFDWAEIIELHHEQKVDAPSGTALTTAREMVQARGKPFERNIPDREPLPGSRAAAHQGITIHAIRLPGLVAHQEVIFGGQGQTLIIRHDSTSRESFIPGVVMAIKRVVGLKEMIYGLDELLGL